uniref:Tryptophanyl-tRNA synthetase n=1 Tax=Oryza sativa subsp. japonica TaxID=39947 RepID=Q6Z5R0_ORYSJ|nr:hypothetical protein [Oryza sativa Japonica Group]
MVDRFGCNRLDAALIDCIAHLTSRLPHRFLRRGIFFAHRDLRRILDLYEAGEKFYLYTGRGGKGLRCKKTAADSVVEPPSATLACRPPLGRQDLLAPAVLLLLGCSCSRAARSRARRRQPAALLLLLTCSRGSTLPPACCSRFARPL